MIAQLTQPRSIIILAATAAFFAVWVFAITPRPLPRFDVAPIPATEAKTPRYEEHFISRGETTETHSANLVVHGGELMAIWYGGSREGAADVALFTAVFSEENGWGEAVPIMDRPTAETDLNRSIRKVGNPVLYSWDDNHLGMFFVTVSIGGWAGSSINYIEGQGSAGELTWGPVQRLVTSPFLNISTLVRHTGIALNDGTLLLPVYHEFIGKFSETIAITRDLRVRAKSRLSRGRQTLQPAIVPTTDKNGTAMLRYAGDAPYRLMATETFDGGLHWKPPHKIELPNPNAAVTVINGENDTQLMVYNDTEDGRHQLALATRQTSEADWTFKVYLEQELSEAETGEKFEFSYPSLVRDTAGTYHLAYTWNQEKIKHIAFNHAWLEAQ